MKINQEQFNKLNQLDRIEFRQKYDYIKENYSGGLFGTNFLVLIMILGLLTFGIGIAGYESIGKDFMWSMLSASTAILTITIYLFIIEFLGRIIYHLLKQKEIRKLEEEYFKIEVKKKK